MIKHTPGPWSLTDNGSAYGKKTMVGIPTGCEDDKMWLDASDAGWVGEAPNSEANARLIAAAPDMLDALKSTRLMLYAWQGTRDPKWPVHAELNRTIEEVESIIAKAEGKE